MQQSAVFSVGEKQKGFPTKNVLIRSLKKVWVGTAGIAESIELQNFMAAKLKVNLFVLLRVALFSGFTVHLIGVQKQRKFCWYVKFSQ